MLVQAAGASYSKDPPGLLWVCEQAAQAEQLKKALCAGDRLMVLGQMLLSSLHTRESMQHHQRATGHLKACSQHGICSQTANAHDTVVA